MDVFAEHAVVENLFKRQVVAVLGRDGVGRRLRVHRDTTGLVQVNVRACVEDDRMRRLSQVGPDRELVGLTSSERRVSRRTRRTRTRMV